MKDDVEALIKKSRGGDREAFSALVVRFQDPVYNMVLQRLGDAEAAFDAAQETFVKAFSALESFRAQSSFKTWLLAIALREAENERRRRRRELRAVPLGEREVADGAVPAPASSAELADDLALVRHVLREADEEDARLVLLRDLEDLSYDEISKALAIPVGTVKSGLHRARARLRAAFERGFEAQVEAVKAAPRKSERVG